MLISHLLSSILILRILSSIIPPLSFNLQTVILSMVFQMLPDLDIFWAKKLNSHHITFFHSPSFWITVFVVFLFLNLITNLFPFWILYLYIVQIMSHLFFDFITGRTAGIPILYPFNKKEFSLFPLNKNQGNFKPFTISKEIKFFKFYLKNRILIVFEFLLCILGVLAIIF